MKNRELFQRDPAVFKRALDAGGSGNEEAGLGSKLILDATLKADCMEASLPPRSLMQRTREDWEATEHPRLDPRDGGVGRAARRGRNRLEMQRWVYQWEPLTVEGQLAWFRAARARDLLFETTAGPIGTAAVYDFDQRIGNAAQWGGSAPRSSRATRTLWSRRATSSIASASRSWA